MMLLSWAWWSQRLAGITAQALLIVGCVLALALGLAWLRHDARMAERQALETRMANARVQQLLLRQRREREAGAIGARAEKDLLRELDASEAINEKLKNQLTERSTQCTPEGRVICYPANVARKLNR